MLLIIYWVSDKLNLTDSYQLGFSLSIFLVRKQKMDALSPKATPNWTIHKNCIALIKGNQKRSLRKNS